MGCVWTFDINVYAQYPLKPSPLLLHLLSPTIATIWHRARVGVQADGPTTTAAHQAL